MGKQGPNPSLSSFTPAVTAPSHPTLQLPPSCGLSDAKLHHLLRSRPRAYEHQQQSLPQCGAGARAARAGRQGSGREGPRGHGREGDAAASAVVEGVDEAAAAGWEGDGPSGGEKENGR